MTADGIHGEVTGLGISIANRTHLLLGSTRECAVSLLLKKTKRNPYSPHFRPFQLFGRPSVLHRNSESQPEINHVPYNHVGFNSENQSAPINQPQSDGKCKESACWNGHIKESKQSAAT
jgi:hypothetical protein